MKFNIASPTCGTCKKFEVEDEKRLVQLNDLRISHEFNGEILSDEFKGYVFRILGGCDKDGFPMKQGVLSNSRVKLLLKRGTVGLQAWRLKDGARRKKSVRGCIVGHDISVLNLIITKEGEEKIEGLTDHTVPRRLGPKRASKIRKLFNLTKEDDVRKFVIRRVLPARDGKKERSKAPKIQRLVTPITLERRRRKLAIKKRNLQKSREERDAYQHMLDRRRALRNQRKRNLAARQMAGARKRELMQARSKEAAEKKAAAAAAAAAQKAQSKPKPAPKGKAAKKK